MSGPCGWTVESCNCSSAEWADFSPEAQATATALATHFIWAATGRRYGLCEVTVMPCNRGVAGPLYQTYPVTGGGGYDPYGGSSAVSIVAGQWRNTGCGAGCRCAAACELSLDGPVDSILEVAIDGEVVDQETYLVHDRRLLVRLGGECWPSCQSYSSEIPGFEVTYLRGTPIPPAVQVAVEALACQFAAACETGVGECTLPPNIQSLTRQGVEVTVQEVDNAKGRMRTGIAKVDDVLEADNPYGLVQPPMVLSPDMPPPGRVVTWAGGS